MPSTPGHLFDKSEFFQKLNRTYKVIYKNEKLSSAGNVILYIPFKI